MTDSDIIKDFELFIKYSADEQVLDKALDLLKRQQQRINELFAECIKQDIEKKLDAKNVPFYCEKSYTILEFQHRLAEKLQKIAPCDFTYPKAIFALEEVAKEMQEKKDEHNKV